MDQLLSPTQVAMLEAVQTPAATDSYAPVPYLDFLHLIGEQAGVAGYDAVVREIKLQHLRARDGGQLVPCMDNAKMFGWMELRARDADSSGIVIEGHTSGAHEAGYTGDAEIDVVTRGQVVKPADDPFGLALILAFQTSHDKSLACGVAFGERVFMCSNMAISGEFRVVRKHTVNVWHDLGDLLSRHFEDAASHHIDMQAFHQAMLDKPLRPYDAKTLLVDLCTNGALPWRFGGDVWQEWSAPSFEDMGERAGSVYGMYQAVTHACFKKLGQNQVVDYSRRLNAVCRQRVN